MAKKAEASGVEGGLGSGEKWIGDRLPSWVEARGKLGHTGEVED